MPNLKGIVGQLIMTVSLLAGLNDPQYKVTPVGFLNMLLENSTTANITNLDQLRQGWTRDILIRYMQRGISDDAVDVPGCETNLTAVWKEKSIGAPLFSKIGIKIDDTLLRKLEENANQPVSLGTPSTQLNIALYQTILTQLNGLTSKIDKNLLGLQSAKWGINPVTGTNTAQTVNFTNEPTMNDGIVKLLSDYQFAEIAGTPQLVGSGIAIKYDIQQRLKRSFDSGGFGSNPINIHFDPNAQTSWGVNHFGVFVPGLTSFVDYLKYAGDFGGYKGGSYFFTFPVPAQLANGTLTTLWFDAQLRYIDCPEKDPETGEVITDTGWAIIISKFYGLFNAPDDMFKASDRLNGFNGSLHYIATAV